MFRCVIGVCAVCAAMVAGAAESALPADRLALAREFARRGLHVEALKELESLVGAPGIAGDELAYRLGEAYRALGRTQEALAQSRAIVASYPKSRYLPYAQLALALAADGPAQLAQLAVLDTPATPKAVRDAARYRLAAHRAQSADAAVRRQAQLTYLDLASSSDARIAGEALYCAALLSYREKRYAEAAALFGRLFKKAPESAHARAARLYAAWANHLAGRPAETLALVQPLAEPPNDDVAYLTAVSLRALEKRAEARAACAKYLRDFPSGRHADAVWQEQLNLLVAEGDDQAVLAALRARGDPPPALAAAAFAAGYEAAARIGDWSLALEYARRAIAAGGSGAARARYMCGVFEARSGQRAAAIRTWTALLAEAPDSPLAPEALHARAMEEIRSGDYTAAHRSFMELARRFPARAEGPENLYWRGTAARGADDLPEAERLFAAALAAGPTPEFRREIQLERAYLLQKRGDKAGAVRAMAQLLETKAVARLPDAELAWLAETALAEKQPETARAAATLLERRTSDPAWRQIAAVLAGHACGALAMGDAAQAAYRRALAVPVKTDRAVEAAVRLGECVSAAGQHEEAAALLADGVVRAHAPHLAAWRLRAYVALAKDRDACGRLSEALGYYMLAGTLFDDPAVVPPALRRAAEILRQQGKAREADDLLADLKKRYEH